MKLHFFGGPHAPLLISTLATTIFIAGCGGGIAEDRVASVRTISTQGAPTYGNLATFTVEGINLDAGLTVSTDGCTGAYILRDENPELIRVTCTPSRDGDISISVNSAAGVTLRSASFAVPKPQVKLTTTLGSLLIELEPTKAPITVKNFLAYVKDGFFTNTVFHRVYPRFVAQGGAFTFDTTYTPKAPTRAAIPLERTTVTGLSNRAKTVGMARTDIPDSATSQFFINFSDNLFLNAQESTDGNGYAVFGTVISSPEVDSDTTLGAIKAIQLINNGGGEISLPAIPPTISAISRIR
jgi:peptidyl-prolyl cis-trans isomerase A (cyclophilin A)